MENILNPTTDLGPLIISLFSTVLSAAAMIFFLIQLAATRRIEKNRLKFEKEKFHAEKTFREEQYQKFREDPAKDIAQHVTEILRRNPDWARRAMEDANLASYTYTIFGERSHHFAEEKRELAKLFAPYLLRRCEQLILKGKSVYILIDAGTTLYPFFKQIGQETARASQNGEKWVDNLHLATNNLPGLEELMKWGRRVSNDRYSRLAIKDCHLLPGIPLPVFAAVAGQETNEAIENLRRRAQDAGKSEPMFIALVVGNWVRIRQSQPRCPVPMARGKEHCEVKNSLVANSDEVFVVSPLGKNFVGRSKDDVNSALGLSKSASRPELRPYQEVNIGDGVARRVKLVSTYRQPKSLLYAHSIHLEEALQDYGVKGRYDHISEDQFAEMETGDIPHLLFGFDALPEGRVRQMEIEFPHYGSRQRADFRRMFHVD